MFGYVKAILLLSRLLFVKICEIFLYRYLVASLLDCRDLLNINYYVFKSESVNAKVIYSVYLLNYIMHLSL